MNIKIVTTIVFVILILLTLSLSTYSYESTIIYIVETEDSIEVYSYDTGKLVHEYGKEDTEHRMLQDILIDVVFENEKNMIYHLMDDVISDMPEYQKANVWD